MEIAKERLINSMTEERRKNYEVVDGDKIVRITRVSAARTSLDEEGLKKALGFKLFGRVTKKVLDRKKLEELMGTGEIDPMVVGKFVTETQTAPHLKITTKELNSEDPGTERI